MHVYKALCTNFKPVKNLQDILPFIHKVTTEPDVFENETIENEMNDFQRDMSKM